MKATRHKEGGYVPNNDERFEKMFSGSLRYSTMYMGMMWCGCNVSPQPIAEKRLFTYKKNINFEMYLN